MRPPLRLIPAALALLFAAGCATPPPAAPAAPLAPGVAYTVTRGALTVTRADTPYDDTPARRDAFLHWFKRGFDDAFAGKPPLMVEWLDSPTGRASAAGHELGRSEGEKHAARADRDFTAHTAILP